MGLKADNAQVGQSGTASQNFNIRAPLDGTLRLSRGNAGAEISDPLKIESNNDVTLLGNLLSGVLGAGQTWQNMTGSRVAATTYTNTTGKAIAIGITVTNTGSSSGFGITANIAGTTHSSIPAQTVGASNMQAYLGIIVPAGATYSVTLTNSVIATWNELR